MQASSHDPHGFVHGKVNEAGMSTTVPEGAQYSAFEWTRARAAIRRVLAPAAQPEPASRVMSATHDVSFLRSDSRCRRYVTTCPNLLGGI